MKPELIVEALNSYVEKERLSLGLKSSIGHFILHRTIDTNPTFKAYKTYKATLWYVVAKKKLPIIQTEVTGKVLNGQEEKMIEELNKELLIKLFDIINKKLIDNIIKGNIEFYETT